ncbi:MAG: phosphoenolpyruvate carboxylase, partial [Algisphaera sp.]
MTPSPTTPTPPAAPASPRQRLSPDTAHRLRRDQRLLELMLGRVLDRFATPGLRQELTATADLARARREGIAVAGTKLRQRLSTASVEDLEQLARAAACFFDVNNLAEERQRVRVLVDAVSRRRAAPYPDSVGDAWVKFAQRHGTTPQAAAAAADLWQQLHIEPVLTAHPTESKRRAVRQSLSRLREDLRLLETERRPIQRRERLDRVRADLGCLWQTDPFRERKPTVAEEVGRSLSYFDTLWAAVPRLCRAARTGHAAAFDAPQPGQQAPTLRSPITIGSWIGGDRDGNPFVTARVTAQTLTRVRAAAISRHLKTCQELSAVLTISSRRQQAPAALLAALDRAAAQWPEALDSSDPAEVYRTWLKIIRYRLHQSDRVIPGGSNPDRVQGAYPNAKAFEADVQVIADALRESGHIELANGPVQDWLDRIATFGLHLARLDIREHAGRLQRVIDELSAALGTPAPADLSDRRDFLLQDIGPSADTLTQTQLSDETTETLAVFTLLEDVGRAYGPDALGARIVSMTTCAADVLAPLWLARVAAAAAGHTTTAAPWPVVPLFETIDDLANSATVLDELLSHKTYAAHVAACGNEQQCMVGYSDSAKDGGYLSACWGLYQAQGALADTADRHNIKLTIFHGRGGSLGRGGGPAARAIRGLPAAAVDGRLRVTEQGEVLSERYDEPKIAQRHLEQITAATFIVTDQGDPKLSATWTDLIAHASSESKTAYRQLISAPGFLTYFAHATPIDQIERLPIGSRPSRRAGTRELSNLRAIPYTFAWTQARCPVTAFYGLGHGLTQAAATVTPSAQQTETGFDQLRAMYRSWPWFHTLIHNAELALVKANIDA